MADAAHEPDATITQVARVLRDAESVLFVTGAGVSADSGLPTYRGVGGLYDGEDTEDGVRIEDALSGPMFAKRPALTWKYLWQIGSSCVGAVPNAAHNIIAAIEAEKHDVWVITQNVDGLHRSVGSKNDSQPRILQGHRPGHCRREPESVRLRHAQGKYRHCS